MADKLKNIKCGEFIPTVIDDSDADYVELQLNDDITIPFTKGTSIRDSRRDEDEPMIMNVIASEAVVAWEAEEVACATCATCATCAACAACATHASKAGWTKTAEYACVATEWWTQLNDDQKKGIVAQIKTSMISILGGVPFVADVRYNIDSSTGEHALQTQKYAPKCLWEVDEGNPPSYCTISNGIAVKHISS